MVGKGEGSTEMRGGEGCRWVLYNTNKARRYGNVDQGRRMDEMVGSDGSTERGGEGCRWVLCNTNKARR